VRRDGKRSRSVVNHSLEEQEQLAIFWNEKCMCTRFPKMGRGTPELVLEVLDVETCRKINILQMGVGR